MVDNRANYIPTPMFQGPEGTKFAINPFATPQPGNQRELLKTRIGEQFSLFCTHCDLPFVDTTEYEHHNVELHGGKKILTCNLCNATFRRQDHLKRHIHSLHNNQKYCVCPVCGKDCKRQDMLLKHIKKKHSAATEVFRCRECTFECSTHSELEKHEFTHSSIDRHLCPHCQTTFKRRDHMLRHVKSQHMKQLVECPICRQSYKRKDHVVRHVREKHKMGLLNADIPKPSPQVLQQRPVLHVSHPSEFGNPRQVIGPPRGRPSYAASYSVSAFNASYCCNTGLCEGEWTINHHMVKRDMLSTDIQPHPVRLEATPNVVGKKLEVDESIGIWNS